MGITLAASSAPTLKFLHRGYGLDHDLSHLKVVAMVLIT